MSTSNNGTNQTIEYKLTLYKSISDTLISERAMNDERIRSYAIKSLNHGLSPEETVINSYLFDVALQMEEAGYHVQVIMNIYASIMTPLARFKQWKDEEKVSIKHWSNLTTIIHNVAYLNPGQQEIQNAVLAHLNNPNDSPEILYSLQKIAHRNLINQALVSLELKPITDDVDNSIFCIHSSVAIVKVIMQMAEVNSKPIREDDIFTGGVFVFVASNHITLLMDEVFEFVSSLCVLELFGMNRADCVQAISGTYNNAIKTSPKAIQALGENFVAWLNNPTAEKFEKLIELYVLFRKCLT